jgi:hypothetical protein
MVSPQGAEISFFSVAGSARAARKPMKTEPKPSGTAFADLERQTARSAKI